MRETEELRKSKAPSNYRRKSAIDRTRKMQERREELAKFQTKTPNKTPQKRNTGRTPREQQGTLNERR